MAVLSPTIIGTAQTGNVSTDIAQCRRADATSPGAIVLTSTIGATPTVTVNIKGSVDGTNFYNIPYSLAATPSTYVVTAITVTTAVTTMYQLQPGHAYQYVRVDFTANTNVTLTTTAYL